MTLYPYTGKLPGCFSYKRPGYETSPDLDMGPDFVPRVSSVCTVVLVQIYYHSAILLGKELTWPIAVWNIKFTKNSIQILHNSCRPLCNYDVWGVEYKTMKQSVKTPLFWSPAAADRQVKNAEVWNQCTEVSHLSMSSALLTVCVEAF